ncbi:carbonic anhydrase [Budvicia aquatica]|uniref:Carbonic anhydrase n=1 Tax=Budvicia aquatica TaxID=82979 RepID=A0A2C6C1W6_9GAMM|nr:carbonic anhydrase [Budvicia aquatica]PHI30340.1 carbonic anhydrase [Budvicia aquatica]VFS49441.1 Carbonic anhydrase [Budvicia aquatica]
MTDKNVSDPIELPRRTLFKKAAGLSILGVAGVIGVSVPGISYAAALTKEQRDSMTPDQVVESLKQGNQRFRSGKPKHHDYLAQKVSSQDGQFPSAVILSCIDSRAPAEILLDTGIGEAFNGRVAGNVANEDLLGSLEFACAAAGAKVVLVIGHTGCGAVKGAIDNVELGNLTGLLEKIKPAVDATKFDGERKSSNDAFVDAVAKTNVQMTVDNIRSKSEILNTLEKEGKIKIVGSMYNLNGGEVVFF